MDRSIFRIKRTKTLHQDWKHKKSAELEKQRRDFLEEKRKLEEFSTISLVYFKEIISQYEGLPFESLLLDNIITQEEYDNLKHFTSLYFIFICPY